MIKISHHQDDLMFRGNSALPLSAGALNSLFLPRFRSIDTAALVTLLWSRFGSGSYSRVVSTLVNVCSPFSGFSRGFIDNPPPVVCPLNSHLLFTFAVKYDTQYDLKTVKYNNTSIRSTYWGSGNDPRKFLTIGISAVEAAQLGLLHVQTNELRYLYNIIGLIFRSIFMHFTPGQISDLKRGQTSTPDYDVYNAKDNYLNSPLSGVLRYPYWTWQFSKKIWEVAPNIIPYVDVDPRLALYYFLFIARNINPNVPSFDGLSKILGTTSDSTSGIAKVLTKSLLSFTQYLNQPSDNQFELVDLLAPNVIASLLYTGKSDLVLTRAHYFEDLENNALALADQLSGSLKHGDLARVFAPYSKTAQSIIYEDSTLISNILNS